MRSFFSGCRNFMEKVAERIGVDLAGTFTHA
jgi:hypothetical protein